MLPPVHKPTSLYGLCAHWDHHLIAREGSRAVLAPLVGSNEEVHRKSGRPGLKFPRGLLSGAKTWPSRIEGQANVLASGPGSGQGHTFRYVLCLARNPRHGIPFVIIKTRDRNCQGRPGYVADEVDWNERGSCSITRRLPVKISTLDQVASAMEETRDVAGRPGYLGPAARAFLRTLGPSFSVDSWLSQGTYTFRTLAGPRGVKYVVMAGRPMPINR